MALLVHAKPIIRNLVISLHQAVEGLIIAGALLGSLLPGILTIAATPIIALVHLAGKVANFFDRRAETLKPAKGDNEDAATKNPDAVASTVCLNTCSCTGI